MNQTIYDSIIIGGGPAGMMAAIQLKRTGKNVIIIEKNEIGGLLRNANWVENYLGFPEGITGHELVQHFINHLSSHDVPVIQTSVTEVKKSQPLEVITNQETFQTRSVILATGTTPRKLNLPGEEDATRLFYERVDFCQSPIYKELQKVIIIGGGDVGFDSALNLKNQNIQPHILTRGELCCLPLLKQRAQEKNITHHTNIQFHEIKNKDNQISVITNQGEFTANAILVTIGRNPSIIETNNLGEKDGLFFTGDVKNGIKRHVQIATGDALSTALEVATFLET